MKLYYVRIFFVRPDEVDMLMNMKAKTFIEEHKLRNGGHGPRIEGGFVAAPNGAAARAFLLGVYDSETRYADENWETCAYVTSVKKAKKIGSFQAAEFNELYF